MKKLYLVMSLMAATSAFSQTTIYSESFGAGAGSTNPSLTTYTGYQNASPIVYSGAADIRDTSTSTGYTGASGQGCVFLASSSSLGDRTLIISGINTQNYININLSFGHYNGIGNTSYVPTVEISEDGTSWTALSYTRTNTGTSVWLLSTPTGTIPSTPNLRIRFTNTPASGVGYRIDDVKLTGTLNNLAVNDTNKKNTFNIFPTQVKDGIIYISSDKNLSKNVKIYDPSSKLIINTKIQNEVNVSTLPKGIYMIQVEENGKTETKKFVIN